MKITNWVLSVGLSWATLTHWQSGDVMRYPIMLVNVYLIFLLWLQDRSRA